MSRTAIFCSGQGYQGADMFDLLADAPEAIPVFKAAEFVLEGKDPRQLVHELGNDELHADKVGQILCCTQAMAAWAVLSAKVPRPLVVAGYSVGELAAWGVAGLLPELSDGPLRTPKREQRCPDFMASRIVGRGVLPFYPHGQAMVTP